jgi:two-component system, cell cycle response regulator
MISAVDELESVIRCIEMGATDYLPKPFNPAVLRARINASLAGKRLRDLELEYLEQVDRVIDAAVAVEGGAYESASLDGVVNRDDALGQLARVFQRMANEVRSREERLKQQVLELRIEIDEARQDQKVAEITETEFFRRLRDQAADLRRIIDS